MGYHKAKIKKGNLGQFSKIREEYQELEDAVDQHCPILILCELSDLLGAIKHFAKKYNILLEDLIAFSNKTEQAFEERTR